MEFLVWLLVLVPTVILLVPTLVFSIECFAGSIQATRSPTAAGAMRPNVAILVPAHDEEAGLGATLKSIKDQMMAGDRLLVVADNCTDRTAALAMAAGAEVLERHDPEHRGKGYALDFGLAYLAKSPPPVVIFIDADCTLLTGTLDELGRVAGATGRPVQSTYLIGAQRAPNTNRRVAEFAFLIKNLVRPRGLSLLGLPCLLTGSGMALPWALVGKAQLAHHHLVEDMKLGIDLAVAGYPPVYCGTAGVRSVFPETSVGTTSQRSRWENGHLAMMMASLPGLFTRRVLFNRDCLALTLDVMVPPMTLLCLSQAVVAFAALAVGLAGFGWTPFVAGIAGLVLLSAATTTAWAVHGRDAMPLRFALNIPRYMLGKAWIYPRAMFGRIDHLWIRTDRNRA